MTVAPLHGPPIEIKGVEDDGTFEGYGSVFGTKDDHADIILPGAFKSSLARRPAAQVKMLWQHRPDEPIGTWSEIEEDERGLRVKGKLLLDIEEGARAYKLMRAGIVDKLSIGYRTIRNRFDKAKGARLLEEVDLWEISPVTFASNPDAGISRVKHRTQFSELVAAINGARRKL